MIATSKAAALKDNHQAAPESQCCLGTWSLEGFSPSDWFSSGLWYKTHQVDNRLSLWSDNYHPWLIYEWTENVMIVIMTPHHDPHLKMELQYLRLLLTGICWRCGGGGPGREGRSVGCWWESWSSWSCGPWLSSWWSRRDRRWRLLRWFNLIIIRLGQITCITLYDIIALIITGLWLIAGLERLIEI